MLSCTISNLFYRGQCEHYFPLSSKFSSRQCLLFFGDQREHKIRLLATKYRGFNTLKKPLAAFSYAFEEILPLRIVQRFARLGHARDSSTPARLLIQSNGIKLKHIDIVV